MHFMRLGKWALALMAAATLAGNGEALYRLAVNAVFLRRSWQSSGSYRSSGDHLDLPRGMVERHVAPDASVYFVCIHSNRLLAVERSQHLAVSWAIGPTPVRFGYDPGIGDADAVLGCAYGPGPEFESAGLDPDAFEEIDEGGGIVLWMRRDRSKPTSARRADVPSPLRELAGLAAPLLVSVVGAMAAGWPGALFGLLLFSIGMAIPPLAGCRPSPGFVMAVSALCLAVSAGPATRRGMRNRLKAGQRAEGGGLMPACRAFLSRKMVWRAVAAGLGFAAVAAALTLSHTFMTPNGLGVSGGRAKLLYLAGGIPDGFFTDAAWSTLQPAYPPGLALITLGSYGLAGGCGEWMTQLLGVAAMAAVLIFFCSRMSAQWAMLVLLAAFFSPLVLRMASQYYAEPLVALFILVGWERVRDGEDDLVGWLLIGAAGWFKNEGLVYLLALWIAMRLFSGARSARWKHLLAAAALPALWHIGCRLHGASLDDFAPLWQPDLRQVRMTLVRMAAYTFAEPWVYAFAYPGCAVALVMVPSKRSPSLKTAAAAAVLCMIGFAWIFGISQAPDFNWHLDSAERLLWVPALLLLRELLGQGSRRIE